MISHKLIVLSFWRPEVHNQGAKGPGLPLSAVDEYLPLLLPASGTPGLPWLWSKHFKPRFHLCMILLSVCLCVSSLTLTRVSAIALRAHLKSRMISSHNMNYLHLQRCYFPIKLHSEVLSGHETSGTLFNV